MSLAFVLRNHAAVTRSSATERLREIIERVQPRAPGTDSPLTLDSIQLVDLLLDVEEEFGISIGRDLPEYSLSSVGMLESALGKIIRARRDDANGKAS